MGGCFSKSDTSNQQTNDELDFPDIDGSMELKTLLAQFSEGEYKTLTYLHNYINNSRNYVGALNNTNCRITQHVLLSILPIRITHDERIIKAKKNIMRLKKTVNSNELSQIALAAISHKYYYVLMSCVGLICYSDTRSILANIIIKVNSYECVLKCLDKIKELNMSNNIAIALIDNWDSININLFKNDTDIMVALYYAYIRYVYEHQRTPNAKLVYIHVGNFLLNNINYNTQWQKNVIGKCNRPKYLPDITLAIFKKIKQY